MSETGTEDSHRLQEVERSPREVSERYGINQHNIYYWMRKYGYGRKRDKRWWLTPEEQHAICALDEETEYSRRSGKQPQSRVQRKRATESFYSIKAKLGVEEQTARLIRLLIDREMSAELFGSFETIAVYNSGYADLFHHERVLLLVAKLMGQDTLGALAVEDGYPFYKFVDTGDREHSTVVYDVRNEVYYIDVPGQILRAPR